MIDETREGRARVAAFALSVVATLLPFAAVTIVPITDLPQQIAQARLLEQALAGDPSYTVQWWHPNTLGYLPILIAWKFSAPLTAGRLAIVLLALGWVITIHYFAKVFRRPPIAACLASIFFFNHATYWGLLNFLCGLPIFLWWLKSCEPRPDPTWRWGVRVLLQLSLLYCAHIMWLAAGLGWLAFRMLGTKTPPTTSLRIGLWCSPLLLLVGYWYPSLISHGFTSDTWWGRSPIGRLHPEWLLNSGLGGLEGNLEVIVGIFVLGWIATTLVQHRTRLAATTDVRLLTAGLGALVVALCAPAVIQGTVLFASRWFPVSLVLISLALPPPIVRRELLAALLAVVALTFSLGTSNTWSEFEREELQGLPEAIALLPGDQLLLGLDFVRTSDRIKGFPFYHLYSYGQVVAGGDLYHSFANLATSLVVFRELPRFTPWTRSLDWRANRVRESDVYAFDYVLVQGPPSVHQRFLADPHLETVGIPARWSLYRIRQDPETTEPDVRS